MMTDCATYSIVINGEIKIGYERELVVNAFASLFNISPEKAKIIVGSKRVLKKGVDLKAAENYKKKLGSIGLGVVLDKHHPEIVKPDKPVKPETKSPKLELEPVQEEKQVKEGPSISVMTDAMVCPKCNLEQPKAEQCTGCGVFVHKVQKKEAGYASGTSTQTKQEQVKQDDNYSVSDAGDLKMYLIPVVVAVLGALLWKFIAVTFEYELGLIAWLIGGAVGFSAAMVGAKGETTGVICAALVVLSIFGGKYMSIASFQENAAETIASAAEQEGIVLHQLYEESLSEAKQFSNTVTGDKSLRKFMVDYGYSESFEDELVSDEEIAEFKEYSQPGLEEMALFQPGFEEWKNVTLTAGIENYSTFDLMVESLGLLDLLFLFLGVGTAFRLGNGEK